MKLFLLLVHKKVEEEGRERERKKRRKVCLWSLCVLVTARFLLVRCVRCTADVTQYMVSLERRRCQAEQRHRLTGKDRRLVQVDGRCGEKKKETRTAQTMKKKKRVNCRWKSKVTCTGQ